MSVDVTVPRGPGPLDGARTLSALFADLEQQAAGQALEARDEEVSALEVASYAEVDLVARLHGSLPAATTAGTAELDVRLLGGQHLRGHLSRVGADFLVLDVEASATQWVIAIEALAAVTGLGPRVLVPAARPLQARLGLRSVLRELADQGIEVSLLMRDGARVEAEVLRVGADFVELRDSGSGVAVVPLAALGALCRR